MIRSARRWLRRVGAYVGTIMDMVLFAGAFIVTYLPQSADAWISGLGTLTRGRVAGTAAAMERALGPASGETEWSEVARSHLRIRVEGRLARVRELHRRGWRAELTLVGAGHLQAALAAGTGVVLWRMDLCSSHIMKRALAEAGWRLVHLSRPSHGARFPTKLGTVIVAPLYQRAEVKYLEERIVVSREGNLGYLRDLMNRLDQNHVVSIMGEAGGGRAARKAAFFGTNRPFATGAPALARRTGATLLPAFTRRLANGKYEVVIEKPVAVDRSLARSDYLDKAVRDFAGRLEEVVRRTPELWNLWRSV